MSLIEVKKKLLMAQQGGVDVSDVFNTSLWTGTGAARTITTGIDSGEGSLVWSKSRSAANGHILIDTVRGAGNYLSTNSAGSSVLNAQSVSSFTSTGYDLGNFSDVNGSGTTQVGWQFRRAEKFFDIVQYTGNGVSGRTIPHSLGVKPGVIIGKRVDASSDWQVYHQAQGATKYGVLNSNAGFATATTRWNNTEPTPSAFTVGNDATVNLNLGTFIAYLFAHDPSPEGLIQCGSYVGNGSATGPVVDLGWRPQYLMIKNATGNGNWQTIDASRGFINGADAVLYPLLSNAEGSVDLANPLSTGFQVSTTSLSANGSGLTYIYMAIREAI